jgi:NAD/NADP transhydrogenase beta subunit
VAQAQHKVRELYDSLTKRGVDVKFAIHPVAGRMPGHMNVLVAEADIPYDRPLDMDEINGFVGNIVRELSGGGAHGLWVLDERVRST